MSQDIRTGTRIPQDSNDAGDVGPHGDISVDVNTEVPNSGDH